MSDELPKGWASARLEEVVTAKKGKKPAVLRNSPADGFVPYLDIHAIEKSVVRQFAEAKSSRLAAKDDLFVVWDGARSGWVGGGITGAIGSTIMALTAQQAESSYVGHFIASQFQTLNNNTRGTGIPHVDPEVFWNLEVPLAPLAEQRRIVAKLETLLGKVDASQQRLAKIPVLLKRFRQSVLAAACSGRLTVDWREGPVTAIESLGQAEAENKYSISDEVSLPELPDSWAHVPIGNIAEFQQGMQIAKKTRFKEPGLDRLPILRIGNYETGFKEDVDYVKLDEDSLIAEPSDVILARTGETRGKILTGYRGVFHNNTFRINYHRKIIVREYLISWLGTDFVQSFIRNSSGRSAQPDLTHKAFGPCPLALPPLPEQQEIVRRVEGLFALADQLEVRLAKARGQVEKLTPSLLARAFAGQLVPQNPNDEPATALLERIRRERNNANDSRQPRRD